MTTGAGSEAAAYARLDAAERILRAAIEELVLGGAGALAMHDVADRAGVSKGLIHYHYRDKDALLARAAERLGDRIALRARRALASSSPESAVGDLRRWAVSEVELGEWGTLLSLADWPAPAVGAAARDTVGVRRATAASMVQQLFEQLGLRPRIPPPLIGELLAALIGGLAFEPDGAPDAGAALDVFILSILGLAD